MLAEACAQLDVLLFDLKSADPVRHERFTGAPLDRILMNLERVHGDFPDLPLTVRTPVVPGFNDREDEQRAIRALVPSGPRVRHETIAYHWMGRPKYAYLGRAYPWSDE